MDATFDPLPLVTNAHLGMLWGSHFRDEYPSVEEHHPLQSAEEDPEQAQVGFQFEVMDDPPVVRQWYVGPNHDRLVQLQPDRLIHNWRRQPGTVYPRYEALRSSFEGHFDAYAGFLEKESLGTPTIRQAEVTYLNRLVRGDGWSDQSELHKVIRTWRPDFGDESLLTDPLEDVRVAWRHRITDGRALFARLYVTVDPVLGGDVVLRLTVRGKPQDGSIGASLDFFDMGRDRIVKAFAAVTTPEMHDVWGRRS